MPRVALVTFAVLFGICGRSTAQDADWTHLGYHCRGGATTAAFVQADNTQRFFPVYPAVLVDPANTTCANLVTTTEATMQYVAVKAGTAKNLACWVATAPGNAKTNTFTVRINEGNSTLTCDITGNTTRSCTDVTHTPSIAIGDRIDISRTSATTPTLSQGGGCSFEVSHIALPTNFASTSIDASGRVDVIKVAGTTQTAGDIISRLPAALVSGRMDASVGAMAANVLTATAINADAITAAKIADGAIDAATFAAGAINAAAIASDAITDAKVASDVTIASVTGSVGSVTGAVGSVTGLTASDVGAIKTKTDFLPSATAGAAGGVFIAGTNAATTITTALTTTFTGNLSGNVTGSVGSVSGAVGSVTGNVGGNVAGSVASVSGNVGGNVSGSVGSIASGGIAATSFAAGAIDASAIAADAIGSSELASSAVTEIQSGLSTLDAAGIRTAVGLATANLDTQLGAIDDFVDTEVAAIKAKTDNLPTDPADESLVIAATDAIMARIGVDGAALTSLGDTRIAHLDADISSRTKPADTQAAVTTVGSVTTKTGYSLTSAYDAAKTAAQAGDVMTLSHAQGFEQNVAFPNYVFVLYDSTTGLPKTGASPSCSIAKNGGSFGSATNTPTERGFGQYLIDLTSGELNALVTALRCTASGASDVNVLFYPVQR